MPADLTLLTGVAWRGVPIRGERLGQLLAALAQHPHGVSDEQLELLIWPDDPPVRATKALQVLVSRVRSLCGPATVQRYDGGYRLGLTTADVDAWQLSDLARAASRALRSKDLTAAAAAATEALVVAAGAGDGTGSGGPLAEVRAQAHVEAELAQVTLGRSLSLMGDHAAALPLLAAAGKIHADDEDLLVALLHSEAKVTGVSAALTRYAAYRSNVRERLGTDPGESLQRAHRELLSADNPTRSGVQFDGTELLGRDRELRDLQALVATGRVTTILGPGGLGKTRLAHVLARDARQPRVHFVELVGITSPDDVVAEVGAALGVRDSVTGRRTLTASQLADIRGRIAQQLDSSPTLLVLDNCEHVVDAVAGLVAFLVVATRDLHVVTTSRSPLNIAAERVFPLGQLADADGVELFCRRARSARPDVEIDPAVVTSIVQRLDGLPLAIELAAARVRAMSVAEIAGRLQDRFSLLRGRDASAPDRHQTLLAVIDWSWNLLVDQDRRALRRLSLFQDGFTLAAAERVVGPDAMTSVESLVDQSLLTVRETSGAMRFRMLETVREFGRLHLSREGDREHAIAAHTEWAVELSARLSAVIFGPQQVEVVDELRAEDTNLTDVLRQALAAPDPETVVVLLGALGAYWAITGDHGRIAVLVDATESALSGWEPPRRLEDVTRMSVSYLIGNVGVAMGRGPGELGELFRRIGPGDIPFALLNYTILIENGFTFPKTSTLEPLMSHTNRQVRLIALQWACILEENEGYPQLASDFARKAIDLWQEADGPWQLAILQTQLSGLAAQMGELTEAARHAEAALPVLISLHAEDDTLQLQCYLAVHLLVEGRLDEAAAVVDEIARAKSGVTMFGSKLVVRATQAELALARGAVGEGLRLYLEAVAEVRELRFPGMSTDGMEPWTMFAESLALAAYARFGDPNSHSGEAEKLRVAVLIQCRNVLNRRTTFLDYPVAGLVLVSLGVWGIFRGSPGPEDSLRMLVLADRFAYHRMMPSVAWQSLAEAAEMLRPGQIAALEKEYGDLRGPELLAEALDVVNRL